MKQLINILTYFQLSLTAKELVAKRPMLDASVWQFLCVVIFIFLLSVLAKTIHLTNQMIMVSFCAHSGFEQERRADETTKYDAGINIGTIVDGYQIVETVNMSENTAPNELLDMLSRFDAVLINCYISSANRTGCEDWKIIDLYEQCLKMGISVYYAHKGSLMYGLSRGNTDNGIYFVLVKGIGERWIDNVLDRVKAYLV